MSPKKDSLQKCTFIEISIWIKKNIYMYINKLGNYRKINYPYYQLKLNLIRARITTTLVLAELKFL